MTHHACRRATAGRCRVFQIAVAFCSGAAALQLLPALWPAPALVGAVLAAGSWIRRFPLLLVFAGGFAWSHLPASAGLAAAWPCERDREELELTGRVAAPALLRDGRTDFEFDVLDSRAPGPLPRRSPARLVSRRASAAAGRTLAHDGALALPPRHGKSRRHGPRTRAVAPGASTRPVMWFRSSRRSEWRPPRAMPSSACVRASRNRLPPRSAPGPSVAVLQGLSVGVRGNISDTLWEVFAVTGVAHLMAISGLHVTGCALLALFAAPAGLAPAAAVAAPGTARIGIGARRCGDGRLCPAVRGVGACAAYSGHGGAARRAATASPQLASACHAFIRGARARGNGSARADDRRLLALFRRDGGAVRRGEPQ